VSAVRRDLKEVGGKALDRRTGSGYEANVGDKEAIIFRAVAESVT
jgi:hypothetical protein